RAVAASACRDIDGGVKRKIEIGVRRGRCNRARTPRPWPLPSAMRQAAPIQLADRGGFPFRFAPQPSLRPIAESFRLVPIAEGHGCVRRKLLTAAVAPQSPAKAAAFFFFQPVDRPFRISRLPPGPSRATPEFRTAITAFLDERRELAIRHRRLGNTKRRKRDLMLPFLVVKNETVLRCRPQAPHAAGSFHTSRPVPGILPPPYPPPLAGEGKGGGVACFRPPISERLAHIGERLDVHILVPDCKLIKIAPGSVDRAAQL